MSLTHVHLLLNHFPTIGMIIGLGVFIAAILIKNNDLKRTGLTIMFFIALIAIPTFATGTAAELALQKMPGVSQSAMETHETAAFIALAVMELTGALSWLGLWQYRRLSRLPSATIAAVLVTGLVTFGLMARAADYGGEIRHPEITTPADQQPEPAKQPLARVIGDGMVNLKWGWPASETVHFIGLSLLVGVVLLVDLRMLGFLKSIPYSTLHRLLPWGVLGFAINVLTGMLFFIGAPPDFYMTNGVFVWKLALILVAGANALYFTVFEQAWAVDANKNAPLPAKVAAASGILIWLGVIFCGQMLPFLGHSF
jgi:uncharacterized membrane protein